MPNKLHFEEYTVDNRFKLYKFKCRETNHGYIKIAYSSKIAVKSIKSKTKSADEPITCTSNN